MKSVTAPPVLLGAQPSTARKSFFRHLDNWAKRTLDICAAFMGLVALLPLFLWIGFLIRRDSPGPIFYRGLRTGKNGNKFNILKFRTMTECPESYSGAKVTAEDDPRVTRLGRRLRDTKLNELPQLWNVLKGEMSLVGPRPEDPDIVMTWPEALRREVLSVRPGITSPASVLYRDEESLLTNHSVMRTYLHSVLPSKLRLDQLYVRHRSLWLDLDVLFWTVLVLLPNLRASVPQEDLLFLGPISRLGRRYVNWFVVDALVTFVSVGVAGVIWRHAEPLDIGVFPALLVALGFAMLYSLTGALLGMNQIAWSQAWAADSWGLVLSATLAGCIAFLANQMWTGDPILPPGMIVFATGLAAGGFVSVRYRSRLISSLANRWLARRGSRLAARERVLIVGGGYTGQFIAWLLCHGTSAGVFHVAGFVDDDLYKQGMRYLGISVIGRRAEIRHLVEQNDIGIIVFAIHNITPQERERLLAICASTPARVLEVPDIVGTLNALVAEKAEGRTGESPAPREPAPAADPLFTAQGFSPVQAQHWLADLERAARAGDLAAVTDQIRLIREGIQRYSP